MLVEERTPFWQDPKKRSLVYQGVTLAIVGGVGYYLFKNTQANLTRQNIASGFGFLSQEAGFDISESVIDYFSDESYGKALKVGFLNTLKVSVVGNVFAVLLGGLVGILSISSNWLVSRISRGYVEMVRNVPLLLQLFFWYTLFSEIFPSVRQAYNPMPGVFVSNRGVVIPAFEAHPVWTWVLLTILGTVVVIIPLIFSWGKKQKEEFGIERPTEWIMGAALILLPLIVWMIGGMPTKFEVPSLQGFNFKGGFTLSPEYISLLLGLVLYTGAFIAEIVRAGILSVNKGQWEASEALGLSGWRTLTLVIIPQALRVIIPPLTSQLLNLTKNSSLAVAIAYPDFVSVANTSLNQTGQAIEMVGLIMLVYLTFSLTTSFAMNWYNKKIKLTER
ncbi:MAG: amino acid ABC transporter permease [Halobacteriovorax sp.]|nr:amino acid ABC transporter permease [Halobacteriovorax sp.]